jgi:hypothetical protein
MPCFQTPAACVLVLMPETKFHTHIKQEAELWFCMLMLVFLGSKRKPKNAIPKYNKLSFHRTGPRCHTSVIIHHDELSFCVVLLASSYGDRISLSIIVMRHQTVTVCKLNGFHLCALTHKAMENTSKCTSGFNALYFMLLHSYQRVSLRVAQKGQNR